MKELQIFSYNEKQVRTVQMSDETMFVLKDVCDVLGISKYRDVVERLDEDERALVKVDTLGGVQSMVAVNESGLYNVILRSDKPEAKPFRRWVTSEVLPSIRKTGAYSAAALSPAEQLLAQAQLMVEQERRIKALEDGQEQMQSTVQKTMEVFTAPVVSPDDWAEAMNHQINTLVERYEANHQKYRSELYKELESTAGVDITMRQTRLRNRMRKGGATASECKSVSKLQVVARDRKLRPIFEGIVRRRAAMLLSASTPESGKAVR